VKTVKKAKETPLSHAQEQEETKELRASLEENDKWIGTKEFVFGGAMGAAGGAAAGLVVARDHNANNLSAKRGEAPMSKGWRAARAAAAYFAVPAAVGSAEHFVSRAVSAVVPRPGFGTGVTLNSRKRGGVVRQFV
jgi:hypothetical protein